MSFYTVKQACLSGGKHYKRGQEVELSDDEAKPLGAAFLEENSDKQVKKAAVKDVEPEGEEEKAPKKKKK